MEAPTIAELSWGTSHNVYGLLEAEAAYESIRRGYWYNFWNDSMIEGGKTIELEAPLEQIPLLVKAGSILPMEEAQQLILHLYPPVKITGGAGDVGGNPYNTLAPNLKFKILTPYTLMREMDTENLDSINFTSSDMGRV